MKALHIEDSGMRAESQKAEDFLVALNQALESLASFNDCETVQISAVTPDAWRKRVRAFSNKT